MSLVLGVHAGSHLIVLSDRRKSKMISDFDVGEAIAFNDDHSKIVQLPGTIVAGCGEVVMLGYIVQAVSDALEAKVVNLAECVKDSAIKRMKEGLPQEQTICGLITLIHNGQSVELHSTKNHGWRIESNRLDPHSFVLHAFAGMPDREDFYRRVILCQQPRHTFATDEDYYIHISRWALGFMEWQLSFDPSISAVFNLVICDVETGKTLNKKLTARGGFDLLTTYQRNKFYTPHGVFPTLEHAQGIYLIQRDQ